ncbi:FhuF 2Fe-2S C-terminal domain-containing protein [Streptomyces sp. yr375]|uniref:(2Fe-2S)-binding protein n=1 Tax=Streptomyces sp. yr375 TaxID=1761906 RepID=UPI0008B74E54|nr:(2Fe-2S)-binding protein [Streptomyces sp. yr375]SEP74969.1 FhuF 2Fe-2S C-terminal domain-containing protein [Streptomyces sp. yr375]
MPVTLETRALGDVYRRLTGLCDVLAVDVLDVTDGRTGVTAVDLTKDQEILDAFVDAEADRIRDRHGAAVPRHVAASRALHDYAWSVALLTSGPWYLERTVPRIRLEDIGLDLATGAYTITPRADLARLAGAPQTGRPGVRTVPHEEALRAELRSAVTDHMAPLLAALAPVARRGSRALWGMVGDDLVSGLWYLGRVLGSEEDGMRAATAVLPDGLSPYPAGADFRYLTDEHGGRHATRTRSGCCMFYAVKSAEACLTCPRTTDAERLRRLA